MLTPLTKTDKLAKKIGLKHNLYFKREDKNIYGSHKGRSIPLMIKKYAETGTTNFVISSSGNAALAAGLFIKEHNKKKSPALSLTIFVGEKINKEKLVLLNELADEQIKIQKVSNPKQSAFQIEKIGHAKNLRQSTDDSALLGYEDLAKELAAIKNLAAVFIPTSSGTTAEGLYNGFKKIGVNPQIHIVQTEACHPIADAIAPHYNDKKASIASAIVDKIAHRKKRIAEIIKNSTGDAWVPSDKEILSTIKLVKEVEGIEISPNSALSVAGLIQATQSGRKFKGPIVCLITGK